MNEEVKKIFVIGWDGIDGCSKNILIENIQSKKIFWKEDIRDLLNSFDMPQFDSMKYYSWSEDKEVDKLIFRGKKIIKVYNLYVCLEYEKDITSEQELMIRSIVRSYVTGLSSKGRDRTSRTEY